MPIPRRLRGLLGLAAIGVVAWEALLAVLLVITPMFTDRTVSWWRDLPKAALAYGATGAACGVLVGLILMLMERERGFSGLTMRRIALWGGLGGTSLSLLFMTVLGAPGQVATTLLILAVFGGVGVVVSTGTLAIARKAPTLPDPSVKELEGE
jgi:hypothetical protein